MFSDGSIDGVEVRELPVFKDERGWLVELFRKDELGEVPPMSYISLTVPGVVRGPHEHEYQSDYFCFVGPSDFKIAAWDNRKDSKTYRKRMLLEAGQGAPASVIIPPGVVHAYKNIGSVNGFVINFPDRLFRGHGKKEAVDETRYEDDLIPVYVFE